MPTNSTKKILYIAVSSETGGVPRHIAYALESAREKGFSIVVACPSDGEYAEKFRNLADAYLDLPLKPYSIRSLFSLNRYVKENGICLVHSHGKGAGMYARPLGILNPGVKVVHTFHGIYVEKYSKAFRMLYLFIERILKHFTDAFVCVSEGERQEAFRLGIAVPQRTYVVNNGVDTKIFCPHAVNKSDYRKQFGLDENAYIAGCVARFDVDKGHEYLIPAFGKFLDVCQEARLLLVGSGEGQDKVRELSEKCGLRDKVIFAGTRSDIPDLLQVFDVFVSASLKEGMPYTLIEAMASGVPIVATDVVGNRDVVTDGKTGRLVAPKDTDALYEGLQKAFCDRNATRQYAENGVSFAKEALSVEMAEEQLFGIYSALLGN